QSPLHNDDQFAIKRGFDKKISFGLLSAVLAAPVVEEQIHSNNSLGYEWSVQFHKPLYIDDTLTFKIMITAEYKSIHSNVTEVVVTNQNGETAAKIKVKSKLFK
ncbi:MAG: MaoC family dehydratase, partial [Eubacterium sp.]|nr:MaoC family dehydratase [Eubacterium sp.]